jgi:predicted molibdopterin-dependent oxidoreductase YjgC
MTTGRIYAHWHTLTRTGKSPKLVRREPSPFVEVHPDDAAELGLAAGQWAELSSRRGVIRLPVKINPGLSRGLVFVPFHWGDQQGDNLATNYLTIPAIDRVAKQPELKYCAVRLVPAPDASEPATDFARTTQQDLPPAVKGEPTPLPHRSDRQTPGIFPGALSKSEEDTGL